MKIETHEDNTGLAPPDSLWSAIDADSYDGPGSPIGWGRTAAEAVSDLIEKLADEVRGRLK